MPWPSGSRCSQAASASGTRAGGPGLLQVPVIALGANITMTRTRRRMIMIMIAHWQQAATGSVTPATVQTVQYYKYGYYSDVAASSVSTKSPYISAISDGAAAA